MFVVSPDCETALSTQQPDPRPLAISRPSLRHLFYARSVGSVRSSRVSPPHTLDLSVLQALPGAGPGKGSNSPEKHESHFSIPLVLAERARCSSPVRECQLLARGRPRPMARVLRGELLVGLLHSHPFIFPRRMLPQLHLFTTLNRSVVSFQIYLREYFFLSHKTGILPQPVL